MATQRISNEPAYVLHRYDWSESSLIQDVFTRQYGRVALVAREALVGWYNAAWLISVILCGRTLKNKKGA